MKRLLLVLIAGLALLPTACMDLDENPVGVLAPESFYKDARDARAAMDAAYGRLSYENAYGRQLTMPLEFLSDEIDIGNPGTAVPRIELNEFRHEAHNEIIGLLWQQLYATASAANLVAEKVPQIESMSQAERDALVGEAKFLRALVYFHLVRMFGAVPYIDAFVSDPTSVANITRTPEDEVYGRIIKDLQEAIPVLPRSWPGGLKSRATQGAAKTVLAKVYLTRKEWAKAAALSEEVIQSGDFALVNDFADLWDPLKQDSKEHIFTIDYVAGLSQGGANDDIEPALHGVRGADFNAWGVSVPSLKVYQSFDDKDYRKEVSFLDSVMVGGKMAPYTQFPYVTERRPHAAKDTRWLGPNAQNSGRDSDQNVPVFRYAEVLLMAAEAINEASGPTGAAYNYLNQVRARARNGGRLGRPSSAPADYQTGSLNKEQFRNAVLEERRIELAFEYKRWYDLVRTGLYMTVFNDPNTSLEYRPNVKAYHKYLPIPQSEIDRNPNLTQNEGY